MTSQDSNPYSPLNAVVAAAARRNLLIRYSLLPYLYTLFFRSRVHGDTVARALFFEQVY